MKVCKIRVEVENILRLAKKLWVSYFEYPNEEKFDEEFKRLLEILYWVGFHQPKTTRKRIAYGVVMFVFLILSILLGNIKDFIEDFRDEKMSAALIIVVILAHMSSMNVQMITIVLKKSSVHDLIKQLHNMHEFEDEEAIAAVRLSSLRMIKTYKLFLLTGASVLSGLRMAGLGSFKLVLPTLYDVLADGFLFSLLMLVNIIHLWLYALLFLPADLLHILGMIRVEANTKFLCEKLEACTSGEDFEENEKNLIACVRYHLAIIE